MKKFALVLLTVAIALSFTGCASMLKTMGGVSQADLAARDAALNEKLDKISATVAQAENALTELDSVKAELARIAAELDATKLTASEIADAKASIEALNARLETISDEALLKLASIIQATLQAAPAQQ